MRNHILVSLAFGLLSGATLVTASTVPCTYDVGSTTLTCSQTYTFDTSSVAGTAGFLDFDFSGSQGSDNATVSIENMSSDGTYGGIDLLSSGGDYFGGPLPATASMDNYNGVLSEFTQGFTYGTTLSFDLDFSEIVSGAATAGTGLVVNFVDDNFNPLLTSDPSDGWILTANLAACQDAVGGCPTSVTDANYFQGASSPGSVPEPGTWLMLIGGSIGLWKLRRRSHYSL